MNSITLSRTSKQLDGWIYLINENFFSPSGFFAEPNWGLPLAIAANLHTPYRIEVGIEKILNIEYKDKEGKGKCVEMGEETSAKFSWFSFNLNANSLIGSSYLGERNLCWLSCWPTRKLLSTITSHPGELSEPDALSSDKQSHALVESDSIAPSFQLNFF